MDNIQNTFDDTQDNKSIKIIISQTQPNQVLPTVIIGLVGMAIIGIIVGWDILPQTEQSIYMSIALIIGVIGFGMTSILSWRKRNEKEILYIDNGIVKLEHTSYKRPVFKSSINETKLQKLRLPGGKIKLYLRDGVRAVEIAENYSAEERRELAERLDNIIKK